MSKKHTEFKGWWKVNYEGSMIGEGFAEKAWEASRNLLKDRVMSVCSIVSEIIKQRNEAQQDFLEIKTQIMQGSQNMACMNLDHLQNRLNLIMKTLEDVNELMKEM